MDIQQIQHVVNLVAHSQLHEVEIKDSDGHIRVKNRLASHITPMGQAALPAVDTSSSEAAIASVAPTHTVTSTFIGRIQLSADIASEPLVKAGDQVAVGDTLAYVASLGKLLPVISEQAGIVQNMLVNHDDKVEYGTPLLALVVSDS